VREAWGVMEAVGRGKKACGPSGKRALQDNFDPVIFSFAKWSRAS
jgi:hypothetical protein